MPCLSATQFCGGPLCCIFSLTTLGNHHRHYHDTACHYHHSPLDIKETPRWVCRPMLQFVRHHHCGRSCPPMFAYDHLIQHLIQQKTWCNPYHVPTRFSYKVRNPRKQAHDQFTVLSNPEPASSVFPQPYANTTTMTSARVWEGGGHWGVVPHLSPPRRARGAMTGLGWCGWRPCALAG